MPKVDLSTVAGRSKLKPRHDPYWQRVSVGSYLGFRKMSAAAPGTWLARNRDEGTGKQRWQALGSFEELPPSERWDTARKAAQVWFEHLGAGGSTEVISVREACERYVKHVRTDPRRRDKTADDLKARFRRWVDATPLGRVELTKLTRGHVKTWRQQLEATPVTMGKGESARTHERSHSAINRDVTALRAALNHAHLEGWITTDAPWAAVLKPIENADRRRDLYLDRAQRRKLIKHAEPDAAALLRGMALLPLRPGALAALTAGQFDKRLGVLTIGKDKAGNDRRISLPSVTAAFLRAQVKDKLPTAPLLSRSNGAAWNKDAWKYPVKEAARAAGLPENTTAYALRHSVITDLVHGGLDLLTVAQLSGTSVTMIERHYGHLLKDHAKNALATLAL